MKNRIHKMFFGLAVLSILGLVGCSGNGSAAHDHDAAGDHGHAHHSQDELTWAVTLRGEYFEIFAEVTGLVEGEPSSSLTHVTFLEDYSAVTDGQVRFVLKNGDREVAAGASNEILREGIFSVDIVPNAPGTFQAWYEVTAGDRSEDILAGDVRVGDNSHPGILLNSEESSNGPSVSFLKEQQWVTRFMVEPVREDTLPSVLRTEAAVRPIAGGVHIVTASLSGIVSGSPWPWEGMKVQGGSNLFRLTPVRGEDESVEALKADVVEVESRLRVAESRLKRIEELYSAEAVSLREKDLAEAEVQSLRARLEAEKGNLDSVVKTLEGDTSVRSTSLKVPLSGVITEVSVSPGAYVKAGDPLARIVQPRPVWFECMIPASEWETLDSITSIRVIKPDGSLSRDLAGSRLKEISRVPNLDQRTGTASLLVEVDVSIFDFPLGKVLRVELDLSSERKGVVAPSSAVVDDAGIFIVYVQNDGETFERREVEILHRNASSLIVSGLDPGELIVTTGAGMIRRTEMLSSGEVHGHVH